MRSEVWMRLAAPLGVVMAGSLAQAGPDSWGEQKNRFGFNARAGFNIEANFKNMGGYPARTEIGPASAGYDHVYDDGYVKVDNSGIPGATWNWGYDRASQVVDATSLSFSSTTSAGNGKLNGVNEDPHWSGEVTFTRELGWNGSYWWGVVAAVNWTDLKFAESSTLATDAIRTRDTYRLPAGAPAPPAAPYRGSYDVPGVQLLDLPSRSVSVLPGGALTRGHYELNGEGYGARLGLLFETPFADWFDLQFGGGVAGMWIESEFNLNETTTIAESGAATRRISDTGADFVVGGYAELGFSLRVSKQFNLYAGAQYCYFTDYTHRLVTEEVRLDMKNTLFGVLGVNYAF